MHYRDEWIDSQIYQSIEYSERIDLPNILLNSWKVNLKPWELIQYNLMANKSQTGLQIGKIGIRPKSCSSLVDYIYLHDLYHRDCKEGQSDSDHSFKCQQFWLTGESVSKSTFHCW